MPTAYQTRKFTISFPEELALKVDLLAKQESRNTSELFREAFRSYFAQQTRTRLKQTQQLAAQSSHARPSKAETRSLLLQARQEIKAARKK